MPKPAKPQSFLESVNCAIEGILWAVRTQHHMLVHLAAALLVLLLALTLHLTLLEFALLTLAITLVLFAELVNTAIEVLVDLVSPDYHPLARRIKDVAAGAVLTASVGAVVIGYLAVSRLLNGRPLPVGEDIMRTTGNLAMLAVVIVILLVVVIKARLGQGTPLHGGMPSGHAGVAFSIATTLIFTDLGILFIGLGWLLAVMVAQSRILLGVHTLREVVAGALLGILVTLLLHGLFG